ncbi:MAG: IPT/TIG domain-containing protein, partial [Acidobacteriota bacterium]|nr:IPT/TIG domain-containing protein [Acidobacteriota bacterium]
DYADETANIDNKPRSTGDPKYNRPDDLKKVVTVNIIDDDLPPLTLSCPPSVSEPSGTGTISVGVPSDHAPGSDATVTLSRVSASSTASTSDYTVEALKIKKNKTSGSATLSVTDDKIDEGTSESLTLRASASDYGPDTCTITLNDDDTRGVTVDPTSLAVDEGGTATYSVELKTQPEGGSVTVSHSESSTKISVSPSSLTFTSGNWSTSQSFTVSGEEDSGHANESATITHSATGGDYGSVTVPDVSVTVDDDEVGPPGITSIRPPLQPPDTEVTISGSNFGSSEGSVSFGSNSVTDITSWSDTSIVCFIPAFASAGTVKVKVTTSGNQTSSGYDYTITGQSPYRRGCGQEEDCTGEEKPQKGGSGGGGSEESEDPPGGGG